MTGPALAPRDVTAVVPDASPLTVVQAREEMAKYGTTLEQVKHAYVPRISESFFNNVKPNGYTGHGLQIVKALAEATNPLAPVVDSKVQFEPHYIGGDKPPVMMDRSGPEREDAWRLYLGLPQVASTFGISSFQPFQKGENKTYFNLPNYEKRMQIPFLLSEIGANGGGAKKVVTNNENVMGNYTLSKGQDDVGHYISYYDKWDLAVPGATHLGHPYEIYGRIYYDPKTQEKIPPTEVEWRKSKLDDSHKTELAKYFQHLTGSR